LATQDVCEKLLAAVAKPADDLKAGRTGPIVASERAWMAALKLLLARPTAARVRNPTLDRWIQLGDATRAKDGLSGDPFARLAITKVAEIRAFVFSARKHFLALNDTEMFAKRVTGPSAKLFLYWTADLLASVLVARLKLLADNLAFKL